MNSQEQRDAILSRDLTERAGEGGLRQFTHHEIFGEPTGWVYRTENPKVIAEGRGGKLSGQPQHEWHCRMFYSDGSMTVIKGHGTRTVPALA